MATSPKLALSLISAEQASQDITHNQAVVGLDICGNLKVSSIGTPTVTPPGSPADGDAYLVGTSATGVWAGKDGKIAYYYQGWYYVTVFEGLCAFADDDKAYWISDGTSWKMKLQDVWTNAGNVSGAVATDAAKVSCVRMVLTGNITLSNPTNSLGGKRIMWRFKQDGTGSRTLTLDSNFRLASGDTVVLSTAANKVDYLEAIYNDGDSKWDVLLFKKTY